MGFSRQIVDQAEKAKTKRGRAARSDNTKGERGLRYVHSEGIVLTADAARCIVRLPLATASNGSHLAAKHPLHQPVSLRSSKLPVPRQNAALRIGDLLSELGISTQKLVMPTRGNIEEFDGLLGAAGALVDMKRQVDRVAQEVRTLRAQREGGYVPPIETRKTRSESVTSTATSATGRKSRLI